MFAKPFILLTLALSLSDSAIASPIADRAAARALLDAQRWDAAAAAYEAIVARDPHHGGDWYRLGLARAHLSDCEAAEPALARAIELGVDGYESGMRKARIEAAACATKRGAIAEALNHVAIAHARLGLEDLAALAAEPRFLKLSKDPRFQRLAGLQDAGNVNRIGAWRRDLDFFVELVERRHPNPFHRISKEDWRAEVAELRRSMSKLDDLRIIGRLMGLAAMIGDGHTAIYPPFEGDRAFHLLPIFAYAFDDGWRIVASDPAHADLAGVKILRINGFPADEAMEKIAALLPYDNERTSLWLASVGLQFAEIGALALGSSDITALALDVESLGGQLKTVRITGEPIDRNPDPVWAPESWVSAEAPDRPMWLAKSDTPYWFKDVDGAVYAQVNQIRDAEEKSFEAFANDLRDRLRSKQTPRLIIDLRHNNGGNGHLNWSLVRAVTETGLSSKRDAIFVIVGRRTFSAAMNLASMLEQRTNAIFVGEPTGSRPNFYGEDTPFVLPNSGLHGTVSSRWFQEGYSSNDERPWIAPDLYCPLTFDDVRSGRDPALDAIKSYLQEIDR